MRTTEPSNGDDVRQIVEARLAALSTGLQETVTVEWRDTQLALPVISMPVDLLSYNPATHRVRAQRSLDALRDADLEADPFGVSAQGYLHDLLRGDPADPSNIDPTFEALKEDLRQHGQRDAGIITRTGVLINGNTRRAALKELGNEHVRVGVLPNDAGPGDMQSIELSLQLRKDHRRDYSFMNLLLALDERVLADRPAGEIQAAFRIKAATFERYRWILAFVRDAIQRSSSEGTEGQQVSLALINFESDQGKLEELYRAYSALKPRSPDAAEALREQRLLAIVMGRSKTDVRLIESDFMDKYMKGTTQLKSSEPEPPMRIPGTSISAAAPSAKVEALRALTNSVLRARAIALAPHRVTPTALSEASSDLKEVGAGLERGLDRAGRQVRVVKKRFAAVDRFSDANDNLDLAVSSIAEARATGNFNADDLDDALLTLRDNIGKLARQISRDRSGTGEGVAWLRAAARLSQTED